MFPRARLAWLAAALLMLPGIAAAQDGFPGGSVVAAVERLKPGEFLWVPNAANAAKCHIRYALPFTSLATALLGLMLD
jgi:hypothetical protein